MRPHGPTRAARPRGFTLMELLVVLAIIVLLVGILLPALGMARKKSKDIATRAQLDSIGKANEQYKISFGAYGGFLSDRDLSDPTSAATSLTSNENLVLSLLGRVTDADVGPRIYPDPSNLTLPAGTHLHVDESGIGSGPRTVNNNGSAQTTYGAFYQAKSAELVAVEGAGGTANTIREFVDVSYGMPILYFRARGGAGQPASADYAGNGAVQVAQVTKYVTAPALKNPKLGRDNNQLYGAPTDAAPNPDGSILSTADAAQNLAWLTINTKLSNLGAAGDSPNNADDVLGAGFFLMATGNDQIYFSATQLSSTGLQTAILNAEELKKFDDIIVSGGTAP